jgi:hypothetical protein
VVQFFNLRDDVVLDGFGQGDAVRNENQFHTETMMRPRAGKIQRKKSEERKIESLQRLALNLCGGNKSHCGRQSERWRW